ncbi:MAG: M50 family metallopeptidase [Chloroflexota bacterium]|nr:M50 family metallopeptidase [Chloroflexota bacterium]
MSLSWLWYLSVIQALGFLIFVHELGHFLTALRMGIRVEEFGFGYPPRIATLFRYRGVPVTINWLPLGGFVRMAGEEGNFESEGSLAQASPWRKIPVLAAGSLMNLVTAAILFSIIAMVGQPDYVGPVTIREVVPGSPADGTLKPGDIILKIDGVAVDSPGTLRELTRERAGREVTLDVQSVNSAGVAEYKSVRLRPRTEAELKPGDGPIGIAPMVPTDQIRDTRYVGGVNPFTAVLRGIGRTLTLLVQMLAALGGLLLSLFGLAPGPGGGMAGPVGIARLTGEVAQQGGLLSLLEWTGILSVNLALINLLPLPALDGSRIVFALLEWVRGGKKVPPEREAMVHAVGMMVLLGLMLVITFADVRNWIGGQNAFGG